MTSADLWAAWRLWMLVASAVVLVAAEPTDHDLAHGPQHRHPRDPGLEGGGGRFATTPA